MVSSYAALLNDIVLLLCQKEKRRIVSIDVTLYISALFILYGEYMCILLIAYPDICFAFRSHSDVFCLVSSGGFQVEPSRLPGVERELRSIGFQRYGHVVVLIFIDSSLSLSLVDFPFSL